MVMGSVKDFFNFIRLPVAVTAVMFSIISYLLFNPLSTNILPLCISIFLLTIFGYSINSVTDTEEDKTNNKLNATFSGGKGIIVSFLACIAGFVFVLMLGTTPTIFYLTTAILYLVYSFLRVKKLYLVKNAFIGFAYINIFLIGSTIQGITLSAVLVGMIFAFFVMIRSIIRDLNDIKGDKKAGLKTLPAVFGYRKTKHIISSLLFMFLVILVSHKLLLAILFSPFILASTYFVQKEKHHIAHAIAVFSFFFFAGVLLMIKIFGVKLI